jgi:hypothetical protein
MQQSSIMSSMVSYQSPEWALPGVRYFRCEPMAATLAIGACAANWRQSHEPGGERLFKCRVCPVGAVHAGDTTASLSPLRGAKICSRCQVGSTRLVYTWLCVSCYNREREWVQGRNAKGKKPTRMQPLHRRTLKVVEAGASRLVTRDLTASQDELMAAALRDSDRAVVFAFNGAPAARFAQAALW